jgi:hypothetical protein
MHEQDQGILSFNFNKCYRSGAFVLRLPFLESAAAHFADCSRPLLLMLQCVTTGCLLCTTLPQEILRVHHIEGFPCSFMMWCSVLTPAV